MVNIFFQDPACTPMKAIVSFHDWLLVLTVPVVVLTCGMLISMKDNQFTLRDNESQKLEFRWTLFPIVIIIMIAGPSLRLLYLIDLNLSDVSVKVVGNQ